MSPTRYQTTLYPATVSSGALLARRQAYYDSINSHPTGWFTFLRIASWYMVETVGIQPTTAALQVQLARLEHVPPNL